MNKNENWLLHYLKKRGIDEKNIFLMTIDDAENINIILKEEK